jgi:hypothetical protein
MIQSCLSAFVSAGTFDLAAARMTLVQAFLVAPAQFIEQMPQMGGERRFGVQALLQPFTHGVTNGPAGPVIELLKVPIDRAIHVWVSWRVGTRRVPLRQVE